MGATPEFTPVSLPFGAALHAAVAAFYRSIKETGARPELASVLVCSNLAFQVAAEILRIGHGAHTKGCNPRHRPNGCHFVPLFSQRL
jgi:hypothetical protein